MRLASMLLPALAVIVPGAALGCPGANGAAGSDAAACGTMSPISFDRLQHVVDVGYSAALSATAEAGTGALLDASVGLALHYTAHLGEAGRRTYDVAVGGGVAVHRLSGAVQATGAATHAEVRLGPAVVADGDTDNRHTNTVSFPLSFEIAHDGDVAALPRLSARPDVLRGVFGHEHVTVATRALRMESEDDNVDAGQAVGPGGRVPRSTALDLFPIRAALDATMQDGLRLETTIAGALLGVAGRGPDRHAVLELLGMEHRAISLPTGTATAIDTCWVIRFDYASPRTGNRYFLGYGGVVSIAEDRALLDELDIDTGELGVGGIGWWHDRAWGGVGWQYRREPYVTMAAEPAMEDRVSIEAYRTGAFTVAGRGFFARTLRLTNDIWQHDTTAGLEVDVSRRVAGFDVALRAEAGRSFYGGLDDRLPAVGYAARAALTIQHAASKQWTR